VLLEHAWLIASLATPPDSIRSAHLLVALLTDPELEQLALRASRQFAKIPIDEVKHQLEKYTHGSQEEKTAAPATAAAPLPTPHARRRWTSTPPA
jgi:type VI secretion system protein VasG